MAIELTEEQNKQGYRVVRLGEITTKIGSGATPRGGSNVYVEKGATLIRSQNVHDNELDLSTAVRIDEEAQNQLKNVLVKENDVLINITGDSIARCATVKKDISRAFVNQHVCILRPNTNLVNNLYLQKALVSPKQKSILLSKSEGGTRKALTKGSLENFEIALPPLSEQERIANILGSLDDKIEANKSLIKTLEKLIDAQVQYRSFKGAEMVKLNNLAQISKAQALPSKLTTASVLHYSLPAFDTGDGPVLEDSSSILSNKFLIDKPCVLFSKLNPDTPRIWMVEPNPDYLNFASTEFVVLEPKTGIDVGSLWSICRDPRISKELKDYARGTSSSHQRVSPSEILAAEVIDTRVSEEETQLIRMKIFENIILKKSGNILLKSLFI